MSRCNDPCWPTCPPQAKHVLQFWPAIVTCAGTISAWVAPVSCFASATEVRQGDLFVVLAARDLHLCRRPRLQFCHQIHSPNQFRHRLTLVP